MAHDPVRHYRMLEYVRPGSIADRQTTYLGYRYWQVERPSAQRGAQTPYDQPPMIQRQESMYEDKGEIQHVA